MNIDHTHFINTLTPSEKLSLMSILGHFDPALTQILEQELQSGNVITSVTKGWPQEGSICVVLNKPFIKAHTHAEVEYEEINDPHYGKAQYASKNSPQHLLICAA